MKLKFGHAAYGNYNIIFLYMEVEKMKIFSHYGQQTHGLLIKCIIALLF